MNMNEFFVTFVNLVLHVISIAAYRSEAFEDWKKELQKSINESADFEKSIEALRYTVINVEKFEGKMEHIFELCQEVLDLGDPDEYVTVIDIRQSSTCEKSFPENMLDIVSCLRRYVAEKQMKEHYTKNLDLMVHSVQNKSLLYFDMLLQSTQNIRSIHDFMQKTFVKCMLKEIENGFNECYNDLVYDVIVKTSLKISENCRTTEQTSVVGEREYREIEEEVLQELKSGKYESILIKRMVDDFYRILETEFGNSLAKIVGEKTLEYQEKTNIKHFDTESVLEEVKKLYSNKLSILFHKKLSILIQKRADELKIIHLSYFEKVYRSLIEYTCNFFASQSGVVPNKSANDIVRNFNEHKQQSMVYLKSLAYDTNNVCGNETDPSEDIQQCYDAENAQDLQCRGKSIKILCNVEITSETILLLIHILNNSNDMIETDADQIIYINMKKAFDEKEISNKIINFAINPKRKKVLSNDGEFDAVKFSLSTKSADKILRCDIDEQLFMDVLNNFKFFDNRNLRLSIHEKIWKGNYYVDVMGNIKISFECTEYVKCIDQKLSCFTHDLQSKNDLTVCIQSALYDCKINISAICDSNGVERVKLSANGEDDTDETRLPAKRKRTSIDQNENNTKDCQPMSKILPLMSTYLKDIQLLSEASEISGFAYTYIVDGVYAEEHSVMVTSQTPSETDELIATKIEEINQNIKQYCKDSASYKLTSLEIKLSDVLKNNGNPNEWNNATKDILESTNISLGCYEKILSTYAIDSNSFNATNNHDTFSVNTDSYCIHMHVIACDNAQSLVCLVRKEMEYDLRILPFTFLLNVYADILQDLESKNVNNSQDIKHLTANTVTCIFKIMLDLNFSMLGDVIAQYEERKLKFTAHLSLLYREKFLHEMPEESEIRLILQYVKKQRDVVKASRSIRITTISIDETDTQNLSINKQFFRKMKPMQ